MAIKERAAAAEQDQAINGEQSSSEELLIISPASRPTKRLPEARVARYSEEPPEDAARSIVRGLDLALSLSLLILLAPLLILISITIFVFDPGPVVFAHRRVGRNGAPFHCYKFRSMYVGAEQRLEAILAADPVRRAEWARDQKLADDPRVTRIGAFLRVTSLDELPQLLNVLKGEMSLVGPRPIVEAEVARYGRFIDAYYSVKPGLTGLWQVTGRSNTSYRRRVATDVLYARSKSVAFDLRILAATVPAVIAARGSM